MKKIKRVPALIAAIFILFSLSTQVYAVGALFSRPRFSTQEYKKMWIKKLDTKVAINEQVSVTRVDQTFYNEMNTSVEAVYIFPLPANATVSELYYTVNGVRYAASIRERAEAVKDYNQKVRQWLDPALLEYLGNNLFRLSIVPIAANSEVRTEITYVEPLSYDFGVVKYGFRLNTMELSSQPLQTVSVSLDAVSKFPYKRFTSPSHGNSTAAKMTKVAENHYTFFFGDEKFYPDKDLEIEFETQRKDIEIHALSYKPSVQDSIGTDGYYTVWITPPDSLTAGEVIPLNVIFAADVSSSMDDSRLSQVKESLNNFLSLLSPQDKFNLVIFGTVVKSFKPDLVAANYDNILAAKAYVNQLYALGMTNIEEALNVSLKQSYGDSTSNNLIFFTDGYPTIGDTNTTTILSHTSAINTKGVRIFSFGVGTEVSKSFLLSLAEENHGFGKFITTNDSIALVINDHFKRISKPVLTDISIDLGGITSKDVYPKTIADLFWGSQINQMGLYEKGNNCQVTLHGKIRSKAVQFTQQVTFVDTAATGYIFVPRLWAKQKIDYLLNLIAMYGETKELVNQVTNLGLKYKILTPYTAFYVDPTSTDVDDHQVKSPDKFALEQNYPNPFNPETRIKYTIPQGRSNYHVIIRIYNALGQLVCTLMDAEQAPGSYSVTWNGKDQKSQMVPSGIYFYSIQADGFSQTRKMMLLK